MSNIYFNSLSGMMAASFGLKGISDNVANMQSPGFKGKSVFYQSLGNGNTAYQFLGGNSGNGVTIGGSYTDFKQGDLEKTNVSTHLAMDGEGFFIIQLKSGSFLYTRDGEFHFNDDGYLVDDHSKGYVMGQSNHGILTKINQNGPSTYPGKPTTEVSLDGTIHWQRKEKNGDDDPDSSQPPDMDKNPFEPMVFSVEVFDDKGDVHQLTLTFEVQDTISSSIDPDTIVLKSVEENGEVLYKDYLGNKTITFDSAGYPSSSQNHFSLNLSFRDKQSQSIRFDFGEQSSSSNHAVQFKQKFEPLPNGLCEVECKVKDGYARGDLYQCHIDNDGQLIYDYTNEQTRQGTKLALARFDDPRAALMADSHNAFKAKNTEGLHIGTANQHQFGQVVSGSLEKSNVSSTGEFANIVILQRMFQACSQIMEVDKQLLEELYKK